MESKTLAEHGVQSFSFGQNMESKTLAEHGVQSFSFGQNMESKTLALELIWSPKL
jgi:hypothetical protein